MPVALSLLQHPTSVRIGNSGLYRRSLKRTRNNFTHAREKDYNLRNFDEFTKHIRSLARKDLIPILETMGKFPHKKQYTVAVLFGHYPHPFNSLKKIVSIQTNTVLFPFNRTACMRCWNDFLTKHLRKR